MTLRWYDVLVNLEEADRPVRMNELASRILASKSGLTRVIDRMEEAGLVERQRPQEDRRAIEVVMTPKGAEALRAARMSTDEESRSTSPSIRTIAPSPRFSTPSGPCMSTCAPCGPVGSAVRRPAALSDAARHRRTRSNRLGRGRVTVGEGCL